MESYEIRTVFTVDGTFFTVVAFDTDGNNLGGDHHWIARHGAERAMAAYRAGTCQHGHWFD